MRTKYNILIALLLLTAAPAPADHDARLGIS